MTDGAIILLILAALAAGAIFGAVGVLSAIGLMLGKAAGASSLPPADRQAHAMSSPELVELEREASDALRAFDEHLDGLQEGRGRPLAGSAAAGKGVPLGPVKAPCLRCLRARRALLRPLRAIFRP